jgi:hypothetical protein
MNCPYIPLFVFGVAVKMDCPQLKCDEFGYNISLCDKDWVWYSLFLESPQKKGISLRQET